MIWIFIALTASTKKPEILLTWAELGYIVSWIFAVVSFVLVLKYKVDKKIDKDSVYDIVKEQRKIDHDVDLEVKEIERQHKFQEKIALDERCQSCRLEVNNKLKAQKEMNEEQIKSMIRIVDRIEKKVDEVSLSQTEFQNKMIELLMNNRTTPRKK